MPNYQWDFVPLRQLFRINGAPIIPANKPMKLFHYHSIPAFDEYGGCTVEFGSEIESNKTQINISSVLVSKLNPRKPRVSLVKPNKDEEHCCSTEFICYEPKDAEEVLEFWRSYFLSAGFARRLEQIAVGSTNSHTRASPRETLDWLVPNPPRSQKKFIANILDTLDTQIRQTEAIITKLQQVKQGLLHDLLTRGIDASGKLRTSREQAPKLYKEYKQGYFPNDWKEIELGCLSEIVSGVTVGGSGKKGKLISVPYLRVANVQDGYLNLNEVKEIFVTPEEKKRYLLEYGDVLMNEGGDFDKLGRGTVWKNQLKECIHQNHVFRVRTQNAKLSPFYLAYWTESNFGKKYFVLSSKQSTNLASINSTQLKAYPIMVPPVEEQTEIEKRMDVINSKINNHRIEMEKLKKQKAGLMDDLLTGHVRVTDLIEQQRAS